MCGGTGVCLNDNSNLAKEVAMGRHQASNEFRIYKWRGLHEEPNSSQSHHICLKLLSLWLGKSNIKIERLKHNSLACTDAVFDKTKKKTRQDCAGRAQSLIVHPIHQRPQAEASLSLPVIKDFTQYFQNVCLV